MLKFIHLGPNKICNAHNPTELKLLTRICLGLSHEFSHNSSDSLDELSTCTDIESMNYYILLQCPLYLSERQTLMEKIHDVEISILDQNENYLCYALLFGCDKYNDFKNVSILSATIEYILLTERFNVPL